MPLIDKSLKILQIVSARNLTFGAMKSMLNLTGGLKDFGHEVQFLTFKGRGGGDQLRELGEKVHEVSVKMKIDPIAIGGMVKVIKELRPDIVHTHLSTSSINGALAAKIANVPSVSTVHGMSGKFSFIFSSQLIAVSQGVKNHLVKQGMDSSKISVVYNGIDFKIPSGEECDVLKQDLKLENRFPIIGTVARLTSLKGIKEAIYAVKELRSTFPNLIYILIGSGDEDASLQALVRELGLENLILFVGYQPCVAPFLQLFDIFLLPSLKEAMGISLVEASLLGKPCVASDVGGIPEVILREWGTLVPPGDVSAISNAIKVLVLDENRRAQVGELAKARAEAKFTLKEMVLNTVEVYRAAIEANNS